MAGDPVTSPQLPRMEGLLNPSGLHCFPWLLSPQPSVKMETAGPSLKAQWPSGLSALISTGHTSQSGPVLERAGRVALPRFLREGGLEQAQGLSEPSDVLSATPHPILGPSPPSPRATAATTRVAARGGGLRVLLSGVLLCRAGHRQL